MKNQEQINTTLDISTSGLSNSSDNKNVSNIFNSQNKYKLKQDVIGVNDVKSQIKKRKSLVQVDVRCIGDKPGFMYCIDCQKNPIKCGDKNCTCQVIHKKCLTYRSIEVFNQKLSSYIVPTSLQKQLSPIFDQIIDNISQLKEKIDAQLEYFGLNKQLKNVFKRIQSNSFKELKGSNLKDIFNVQNICYQNYWSDILESYQEILEQFQIKIKASFQKLKNKIIQSTINNNIKKFNFFNDSKILKQKKDKIKMYSMLNEKKDIYKIQKIYTATQDGFNYQKKKYLPKGFSSKCLNKKNLLYLVKNQYDKQYGAFSPCKLTYQNINQYIEDHQQKTFIFSLDMNCKSKITSKQFAVQHGFKNQQTAVLVAFGQKHNCSLVIGQNSDKQSNINWIKGYGHSFQKNKFNLQQLNGTPNKKCKLKQIEVFQIHFKQK